MKKINKFNLKHIKFISQFQLFFFFKIAVVLTLSSCSHVNQYINKKNDLIYESFCDRWLNRRISDNQILTELRLYDFNNLDEIKNLCKKYEHLINDKEYCGDWLNNRISDKEVIQKFGYADISKGLNEISLICKNYEYLIN